MFRCLICSLMLVFTAMAFAQEGTTEKFDIEAFNRNKSGYSWFHTLQDGKKVWEREIHGKGYHIETTVPNSAYTDIKVFNYDGNLIANFLNFYNITIGVSKEYDGKGNVTKQHNQDNGFAFSVDDLIKKMRDEFKVDITNTRQVLHVSRGIDTFSEQGIPFYGLYVYDFSHGERTTQTIVYLFHGGTGELLSTVPGDIEGRPSIMTVYEEWLARKKP